MFSSFYIKSYNKKSIKDTTASPNDQHMNGNGYTAANGKLMNGNGVAKALSNGAANGHCTPSSCTNNNSSSSQQTAKKEN